MLSKGYFIGGVGGSGGSGHGGESSDVFLENGDIMFAPFDPIHIDDNENVFYDTEDKNAIMYTESGDIFVEKV